MMKTLDFYGHKLEEQIISDSFRKLEPVEVCGKYIIKDGKKLLNLASNDYLGISTQQQISQEFLQNYKKPLSVPSARLLCANTESYFELENFLKTQFKKEAALLFNSGYHANVGIYSALTKKGDAVFCDRLNHASIIDGIRLGGADLIPFKHADYEDLAHKLERYRKKYRNVIISSEALFSMDGDFCDIKKLVELKEKFEAILVIDEAHSFGVYGGGLGYCAQQNELKNVDLIMATFGKAVGSYGAFCAGSGVLIDYLKNFARSFIFSTVFPQISAEFALYVLKNYIFKDNALQEKLFALKDYVNSALGGSSQIVPVVLGENKRAIQASKVLFENGYYCLPIRYPTVAKNQARLRISLTSAIKQEDIEPLIGILRTKYTNSALS